MGFPFHLDEDIELQPPEDTYDMKAFKSPMIGESLKLNATDVPTQAYDAPPPKSSPDIKGEAQAAQALSDSKPTTTPSVPAVPDGRYSTSFSNADIENAKRILMNSINEPSGKQVDSVPVVVSRAPAWYQNNPDYSGAPPSHSWAKDLLGALGGAIGGMNAAYANDPLRPSWMKAEDAKNGAIAQGLMGMAGSAFDKKREAYDAAQEAAGKQAVMNTVSSNKTASATQAGRAQNLLNAALRERQIEQEIKHQGVQDQILQNMHNPDTDEVQASKNFLVSMGMATPEQLEGQTLATLKAQYPILATLERQEGIGRQHEADAYNRARQTILASNLSNDEKARQLHNLDIQHNAENNVPGVVWDTGVAPSTQAVEEVRNTMDIRTTTMQELQQMKAIQNELNQMGHGMTGLIDKYLGGVVHTPEAQLAQKLVSRARQIAQNLRTQERARDHMGVPQEFELALVKSLIPEAGSISGWLTGEANWDGLSQTIDQATRNRVLFYGGHLAGEAPAGKMPSYETNQHAVPPLKAVQGRQIVDRPDESPTGSEPEDSEPIPQVDEKLPVTGAVPKAPIQAQPQTKKYEITPADGSAPFFRDLDPDKLRQAQRAVGPDGKRLFTIREAP